MREPAKASATSAGTKTFIAQVRSRVPVAPNLRPGHEDRRWRSFGSRGDRCAVEQVGRRASRRPRLSSRSRSAGSEKRATAMTRLSRRRALGEPRPASDPSCRRRRARGCRPRPQRDRRSAPARAWSGNPRAPRHRRTAPAGTPASGRCRFRGGGRSRCGAHPLAPELSLAVEVRAAIHSIGRDAAPAPDVLGGDVDLGKGDPLPFGHGGDDLSRGRGDVEWPKLSNSTPGAATSWPTRQDMAMTVTFSSARVEASPRTRSPLQPQTSR